MAFICFYCHLHVVPSLVLLSLLPVVCCDLSASSKEHGDGDDDDDDDDDDDVLLPVKRLAY